MAALCELAIETVLEMRVNVVRRPVAVCQANEQEGHGVKNQSEKTNLKALKAPFKKEKCRNDTYFSFCSPHAVDFPLPVP